MITNLLQVLLVFIVFFPTKYIIWKITEEDKVPMFLHYMPYICYKCCSFWALTSIYLTLGLILQLWIAMGVGLALTALDTVAYIIHQKNNTVKLEDFDK